MIKKSLLITICLIALAAVVHANNYALNFDGTDDYVDCGAINLSGSTLTLECWINPKNFDNPGEGCINLIGTEDGSNAAFLRLGDGDTNMNKIQFVLQISGAQQKLWAITGLSANTWYHIAGVYDAASGMKIYINGILDSSNTQSGAFTSNSTYLIGSNTNGKRAFDGQMDEVRVWNTARTEAEIKANMYKEIATPPTELKAYYKMNDGGGTSLADNSGNNNTGTILGSSWVESFPRTYNVTINDSANSINGTWATDSPSAGTDTWTPSGTGATVSITEIQDKLNAGKSVVINTGTANGEHGTITVSNAIAKTSGGDATLTLEAAYRININAAISSNPNKLNFIATAGKVITDRGRIGQFNLFSGATITTNGGNIILEGVNNSAAGGSFSWEGNSYSCSGTTCRAIEVDGIINAGGGNISLTGLRHNGGTTRGVQINNSVTTTGSGTITINAQGDGTSDGSNIGASGSIEAVNGNITITGDAATTGSGISTDAGSQVKTTGTGNISLISTKGAISGSNLTVISGGTTTITAPTDAAITLDNTNNDFTGAVSITSGGATTLVDKNDLTLGAISVSGAINIASGVGESGNFTLTGAIATTDTTSSAVTLNAGKAAAAGTTTGGDIIISGGSVSVGAGGTALLYTGSIAGSTGVTELTGYVSSYYNSDETSGLAPWVGLYVAYRDLEPSVTYNITISTSASSGGAWATDSPTAGTDAWTPSATGATVSITEIQDKLNAGKSVLISTGSGAGETGDLTINSSITKTAGAEATLTLHAFRNIAVNSQISGSSGFPLNLVLSSRAAAGAVETTLGDVKINAHIKSFGGDITIGGGDSTASGYAIASGTSSNIGGVVISGSYIIDATSDGSGAANTTIPTVATGGNITIRGKGNTTATQANWGIQLRTGSVITGGNGTIELVGYGGNGGNYFWGVASVGVSIEANAYIKANSGNITIKGYAGTGYDRYGIGSGDGSTNNFIGTKGTLTLDGDSLLIRDGTLKVQGGAGGIDIKIPIVGCQTGSGCAVSTLIASGAGDLRLYGDAQAWSATNTYPTRTDNIFVASTNSVAPQTITLSQALYAFGGVIKYNVTYDGNGADSGSVPIDSNTYAESATVTVLGNTATLTKSGYTFDGWNTQSNGSGTTYQPAATFSMGTASVTLYAKWTSSGPTATAPTVGDGSTTPYEIGTLENLYWIAADSSRWAYNYKQTADIDASVTSTWDSGAGWTPIGNNTTKFTGIYDGNGYVINNLTINRPTEYNVGFFGVTSTPAKIRNLTLEGTITGKASVGAIVGVAESGSTIENCVADIAVTAIYNGTGGAGGEQWADAGGIAGDNYGTIVNSSSTGSVSAQGRNVGGLVGYNENCTIQRCFSRANVSITNGNLEGAIGGLVGTLLGTSVIANCYASGTVTASSSYTTTLSAGVGGLVGNIRDTLPTISYSYANGLVTNSEIAGASVTGGLVGVNALGTFANITESFWNNQTSGQASSAGGTGKTTAEMKQMATFTNWDFPTTWHIDESATDPDNNGYPSLAWQGLRHQAATTTKLQEFSSSTTLTDNFTDGTNGNGTNFVWNASAGLSGGGGVAVTLGSDNIWTTKEAYTLNVGSTYTLSAYCQIGGNGGYGALGFSTIPVNSASGSNGMPGSGNFMGVSFHGGNGNWLNDSLLNPDLGGWTDLTYSPTWYFFELVVENTGSNNFNLTFTIKNSDSSGTLGTTHTQHTTTLTNANIASSTALYVFFSADGNRVSAIDNFTIQLSGGAQITSPYHISYDANGGTGTAPPTQTKLHDQPLTLATNSGNLAKTGYTFAGWNTAADGSGTTYAAGSSYTDNVAITLYAKWLQQLDALQFDGVDDYVGCGNLAALQITGTITVEAWIKRQNVNNATQAVVSKYDHSGSHGGYELGISDLNKPYFAVGPNWNDWSGTVTGDVINANQWYHVAGTYDGAYVRLYVDGVLKNTFAYTAGIVDSGYELRLGHRIGPFFPFTGQLDEVRIWNIVRTETEIANNINNELTGSESGLVAYYKMNEGAGTSLDDGSPNSNTGTFGGSPTWVAGKTLSAPATTYTVTGTSRFWSGGGTVSPATQTVNAGATPTLTITPSTGSSISTVTGCGGALVGNTYTTGAITADCTVTATFTLNSYTVTGSVAGGTGGTITPSRTVNHGGTTTFTITPDWGYELATLTYCENPVTPLPSLSGNIYSYTTSAVTANCNLSATFTPKTYTVTAIAAANGKINGASQATETVTHGDTTSFTITPDTGYVINYVLGCNSDNTGGLSGNTYTTGHITGDCKIMAFFKSQ